ncbi:MAG: restriction endonuclease subunit S, partial [Streptococcus sp.]|nr:restriction endonuclease subunit S [Streptococcus sp.]
TDGTHDSPKQTEFGKYLITSKHIKDNRIDFESAYKISEDDYNKIITRSKVDQWDIIISMIGAYCGFCCIESSKQTDYAIKNVGLLKVGNELKCKWLYYYLTSPHGKQQLSKLRSGSSQPYISLGALRNLDIPVPNENTMSDIVSVLSSLDSKIELNRCINDNLEQQAQLLFDNLINASDWSTTQFLSELSEINPPRKLSKGEYAPFVEMSNMPTSGSFPSRIDYKEYNGGMKFRNGDTIMARITPCLENGKAAYVNFLKENEIGFGSTEYIVLAPKKTISSSFLYFLVRNKEFVDYAVKHMNGSSGRQRVSGDTIGNYQLPILDRNKLSIFIAIADRTLSKIRQNSFEIINLAKQRDTLLPKLMFGELKINDLNC